MKTHTSWNVQTTLKHYKDCQQSFVKLKKKTIETIWIEELNELEEKYKKYQISRSKRVYGILEKKKVKKKKKKKK